jgi:hypothetical protein
VIDPHASKPDRQPDPGAGTSNLHAEGRTQQEIFTAIRGMFEELAEHANGPVTVDHIWLYFDNEPGPEPAGEVVELFG